MTTFNKFSKYYDLIYRDKDYISEAKYVHSLIKKENPTSKSILNLGCGTGMHDHYFANHNYSVTGIDLSAEMIAIAQKKAKDLNLPINFSTGDISKLKLNQKFDNVISLFHVMCYLVDTNNLASTINNAYEHLNENGLFIFDFWYGPGVVSDKPQTRSKKIPTEEGSLHRITTSKIDSNTNTVEVNFDFIINENNKFISFQESHLVRYFFFPELKYLLEKTGFKDIQLLEWMSETDLPNFNSWNALIKCKK